MDTEKEINDLKEENKRLRRVMDKMQNEIGNLVSDLALVEKQLDEIKKQLGERERK
jgi:prefoldin subunit 5